MVRAAGASSGEALESLCAAYWFPLYAYVRRQGFSKEDAEDLTQSFIVKLLERQDFAGLKQENERFRAFLLAALKNFLSNERDRAGCLKRGGNITHFSLDWQSAETQFQIAAAMEMDEGAVRVAVHRLRKRYRELLKNEVAQTLADPTMVDDELAVLVETFR